MTDEPRTHRSPAFRALVAQMRQRPAGSRSVAELRAGFEAQARSADAPPESLRADDADGVPVEWVEPPQRESEGVLLYLHGGGYVIGSIATHRDLTVRLAHRTRTRVLSVGYRLAPEDPFPAAVEDAVTAYRWLRRQLADTVPIAVAGDSAGGGLAMALMIALRDAGDPLPGAAALLSPKVELRQTGSSYDVQAPHDPVLTVESSWAHSRRYIADDRDFGNPLASPLLADLHGLPAVYIQVGTAEILLDDSLRLARRLREAGVAVDLDVWPEGIHVLALFASTVPEAASAVAAVGDFLAKQFGTRQDGSRTSAGGPLGPPLEV
jgi:epsilon-lactone hydrolase